MKPFLQAAELWREEDVARDFTDGGHAVVFMGVRLLSCLAQAERQGLHYVHIQHLLTCNSLSPFDFTFHSVWQLREKLLHLPHLNIL